MLRKSLLFIAALGVLALPARADELLLGIKGGLFATDFADAENEDPFLGASLMIGYEFLDLVAADIGFELEHTTSLTEGEADGPEYNYQGTALALSLRTAGPVYFIGRLGYADTQYDWRNAPSIDDKAGLVTLGIGFSTGIRWELQLDRYSFDENDRDEALYLSLGLSF